MKLDNKDKKRLMELIEICKKYQGEYIPGDHGPGSWATTYSNQFIEAASEMYAIYKMAGSYWPIFSLSKDLKGAGVRSCRGSIMSTDRVEYLYNTNLKSRIAKYS